MILVIKRCLVVIGMILSTSIASNSFGAAVLQMSTEGVVDHAEAAFHGAVVERKSSWAANGNAIVTFVTFEVIEVLKGDLGSQVTLRFAGGTVDNLTQSFSGLRIPDVGQEGVYFVESLSRAQASPFVGWNQGHFRVQHVDGTARVLTADMQSISYIDLTRQPAYQALNENRSSGIMTGSLPAMSLGEFKNEMLLVISRQGML